MRILAVYSIKGGVGKTATAVNLAYLSAAAGARTLLWDLDPQGAATYYLRVEPRVDAKLRKLVRGKKPLARFIRGTDHEGLDLLPADFSLRNLDLALDGTARPRKRLARLIRPLASDYDHLYIDCAPSISLVSEGIFAAADALLIPTIPTTLSLRTLDQVCDHLARAGPRQLRILPFFCMVDSRKALHRRIVESTGGRPCAFLETRIPLASIVERMGLERAPVACYAGGSAAARAYAALWREALERSGSRMAWIEDVPGGQSD